MLIVTTESGNITKINTDKKVFKRENTCANDLFNDSQWVPYERLVTCEVGVPLVLTYLDTRDKKIVHRITTTVVSIEGK